MDPLRFDALTRRLARGTSRRQLLKGLGAALAGSLAVGSQPAAADNQCKPSGHLPQSKCTKGAQCCSGVCNQGQCCTPLTSCVADQCGTTIPDNCGGTITCPACPTTTTTPAPTTIPPTTTVAPTTTTTAPTTTTTTTPAPVACTTGGDVCNEVTSCGPSGSRCTCVTTLTGDILCRGSAACSSCMSDADCLTLYGPGAVCVPAAACCFGGTACAIPCPGM